MLMTNITNEKVRIDYRDSLAGIIKNMEELKIDREINLSELKRLDEETQDILHIIENLTFNASQGYNLAKRLQEIRRERRVIKDRMEQQSEIYNLLQSYEARFKNTLERTLDKVDNLGKRQPKRKYTLRRLTELQGFNDLANEQRGLA